MKTTDIFDKLNNTIGNHMDGKATDQDLIKMAYEIDKYLLEHPHPHDLVKNHGVLHHVSGICYLKRVSENAGSTTCGKRYEPNGFKYCPYCGKKAKIIY